MNPFFMRAAVEHEPRTKRQLSAVCRPARTATILLDHRYVSAGGWSAQYRLQAEKLEI